MSDINHEAARKCAEAMSQAGKEYPQHRHMSPNKELLLLSDAYLDLTTQFVQLQKYLCDNTPLQSDDFTRGEEYGARACARLINDVLNGKTDGVMCGPIGEARQRLIDHIAAANAKVEALAEMVREAYRAGCSDAANYEQGHGQGHQGKDVLDDLAAIMKDRDNG